MNAAAHYICSISGVSLLCGIVCGLLKGSAVHSTAKLVCGILLTISVLYPIPRIFDWNISEIKIPQIYDGDLFAAEGEENSKNAMAKIISDKTRAYILDMAESMDMEIEVEIVLGDDVPPLPEFVQITGEITPYQKLHLEEIIQEDLNIPKENQIWIG